MTNFSHPSLDAIEADRMRALLGAVLAVGSDMDLPAMLRRLVESAAALVDARYGALGVLDEAGVGLAQFITTGLTDEQIAAIGPLPKGHGILGLLIAEPEPIRLPDLTRHPDSYGFPPNHPPMTSFLGVPIRLRRQVFGNLYLTDKQNGSTFTDDDVAIVSALASAAALAIENARLQSRLREAVLGEDRERIARDLHDTVIQRLFATGLSLQAVVRRIDDADVARRVEAAIDALDATVTQIRTTIFELESTHETIGLRADLLALAREAQRMLSFEPGLSFHGPLDATVTGDRAAALLAVVREALANAAKHARATSISVEVTVENGHVAATVVDNGRGFDNSHNSGGHGLRNLARRAKDLGGEMSITGEPEQGTTLRWRVPV